MKKINITLLSVSLLLVFSVTGESADWPQFRFNANRGAVSPETLPAQLHLQWVREFTEPSPAYPGELRLRYDATYEPVVMGESVFVPSMVNDSVTALETSSGKVQWRFFTGGPIRFAPLAVKGRVYFGSDDGYLYCVNAADGELLWKYYGRPGDRADRNLLGNRRLIPMWPVRGGPVMDEGVIYFSAGLWPEEGIFIHAVDAETGEAVWTNSDTDKVEKGNLDHGVQQLMGLSPQGYLAVVDGRLVAPCGTQLPAVFDLKTGELGPYTMGWGGRTGLPKGTWFVAGSGQYLAHSGDLYDMRRPNDEKFPESGDKADFKNRLYPAGFTRVQIDPTNQKYLGDFRRPVLSAETMFYTDGGIVAEDITEVKLEARTEDPRRSNDRYPDKWQATFPRRWKLETDLRVRIQAGKRLYASGPGTVAAIDLPASDGQPTISWKASVEGEPVSVVAANGRLFVTTREGRLYAFGEKEIAEPVVHAKPSAPAGDAAAQAASIVEAARATGGYCLVLGLEDGSLAETLAEQFTVIAIDPDAAKVDALRRSLHARGIYGSQISVHVGDPLTHSFPPFLASLVVTETPEIFATEAGTASFPEIFHTLRPYGGTACLPIAEADRTAWTESAEQIQTARTGESGQWLLLSRMGALPEAADWSHAGANAGNTGGSEDSYLRGKLGLLWYDGSIRWNRQPGKTEVRVAGGRIFVRADRMLAIDVFTGRRLWDRPLPQAAGASSVGEFVAVEDAIYVATGRACLVLDAATGEQQAELPMPKEIAGTLIHVRLWKDSLVGQLGKTVICLDRATGTLQWSFTATRDQLSVAVGGGRVYVAELINTRRGETVKESGLKTTALDVHTGKTVWQAPGGTDVRYSEPHDLLLTSTAIFNGSDGTVHREGGGTGYIAGDNLLLGGPDNFVMKHLTSGVDVADRLKWYRRGCTALRTSSYLVTTRYRGNAAYIDLETQEFHPIWNLRGACSNNIFPANGVLNVPNLSGGCTCNYTPTSMALVPLGVLRPAKKK
jgi:outer membrane protein assembly factor BamB